MKKLSNTLLADISKELAEIVRNEEKEVLAVDFTKNKTFGTVDLWNIQRQRKRRVQKTMLSPLG